MIRVLRALAWMRWRQILNGFRKSRRDTLERASRLAEFAVPVILGVLALAVLVLAVLGPLGLRGGDGDGLVGHVGLLRRRVLSGHGAGCGWRGLAALAGENRVDEIRLAQAAEGVEADLRGDGVKIGERAGLERGAVEHGHVGSSGKVGGHPATLRAAAGDGAAPG